MAYTISSKARAKAKLLYAEVEKRGGEEGDVLEVEVLKDRRRYAGYLPRARRFK